MEAFLSANIIPQGGEGAGDLPKKVLLSERKTLLVAFVVLLSLLSVGDLL